MKTRMLLPLLGALALAACARTGEDAAPASAASESTASAPEIAMAAPGGQAMVQDDVSQKDVVKVAVGSPDHTTLVTALKAADLVNSLANAGPFTVFAPTNAAFEKLPAGTVENLLKPANKATLAGILEHHVAVPALDSTSLTDGLVLGMADGGKTTITRKGNDIFVDGAKVLAKVRASNGWVYVIDGVVLPK